MNFFTLKNKTGVERRDEWYGVKDWHVKVTRPAEGLFLLQGEGLVWWALLPMVNRECDICFNTSSQNMKGVRKLYFILTISTKKNKKSNVFVEKVHGMLCIGNIGLCGQRGLIELVSIILFAKSRPKFKFRCRKSLHKCKCQMEISYIENLLITT